MTDNAKMPHNLGNLDQGHDKLAEEIHQSGFMWVYHSRIKPHSVIEKMSHIKTSDVSYNIMEVTMCLVRLMLSLNDSKMYDQKLVGMSSS